MVQLRQATASLRLVLADLMGKGGPAGNDDPPVPHPT